jgi:hypothetical protein
MDNHSASTVKPSACWTRFALPAIKDENQQNVNSRVARERADWDRIFTITGTGGFVLKTCPRVRMGAEVGKSSQKNASSPSQVKSNQVKSDRLT